MIQATCARLSTWTLSLSGFSPFWLSWVLGGLAALAMPPIQVWILLPVAFSGFLILLENTKTAKTAFWLGWVFGFGYFLGGLYWLGNGPRTVGMMLAVPFAAVGLPLCLAFFPAFVSLLTFRVSKGPLTRVFAFAAIWSIFEYLRGHILTGLPWNLLGYTWGTSVLQITSIIGIYGLSTLTTLAACVFASRHKGWISGMVLSFGALWLWGDYRLTQALPFSQQEHGTLNLRIVQASIPQNTKWLAENFQQNLDRYIALSHLPAEKPLEAVIWPEASVTTMVENYPPLLKILGEAGPQGGLLLFGAPREIDGHLRTSMMALDNEGKRVGVYDKSHLVPFGEYMPLRSILTIKKLTYGDQDYTPGPGVQTISLPGLPSVSPLICYEAIFPHEVIDGKNRPYWMLNMTNDAWYGHTSGPYQHLQIVRVRAIEEGIPLVRAANNGISAVVDAWGRILYRLELDEIGFIDFSLPKRLESVTLYQRYGDLLFLGIVFVLLSLVATYRPHEKTKKLKI
ncbi:MAG: apolipoprotein N-acyltransferase [Alphaproteobacteria bacterium]|nr:apolipoprotein N-acyltransferase [Alphaproteobacteria bacterium]